MRRLLILTALASAPTWPGAASADEDFAGGKAASTLAVYGDSPYGTTPTDTSQTDLTPSFIAAVNSDPAVDLVLHVGDIHSGKQFCTEAYDRTIFQLWTAFRKPLIYTPGDNEWADCHKTGEGGGAFNKVTGQIDYVLDANGTPVDYAKGDPAANLALIRSIFFSRPGRALGAGNKFVLSQALAFATKLSGLHKPYELVVYAKDIHEAANNRDSAAGPDTPGRASRRPLSPPASAPTAPTVAAREITRLRGGVQTPTAAMPAPSSTRASTGPPPESAP